MRRIAEDQTLFLPPFATSDETRASARYRWSCSGRGTEPFVIVQWTRSGCGVFRFDEKDHPVPSGTAFVALVPETAEYRYEAGSSEPWRFAWINFYGALSIGLWRVLRDAVGPVFPLPPASDAGRRFNQLIADVCARRFADRYEASAAGYKFFTTLCRQLNSPPGVAPGRDRTTAAVRRATSQLATGASSVVKSLASEAGVTREHFSRVFKAQHGVSPGAFLRLQRLRAADEMLRTTSLPLKEIALRCGFSSSRHFANAFRARHGHSPPRSRSIA